VLNSVSHDARVIKEAESLQRVGFEVEIFGIQDARQNSPRTELPSGVVINRCDWKADAHQRAGQCFLAVGFVLVSVLIILYSLCVILRSEIALVLTSGVFLYAVGLVPLLALSIPFIRKADKFFTIAAKLRADTQSVASKRVSRRPLRVLWNDMLDMCRRFAFREVQLRAISKAALAFKPGIVHCHDLSTVPIGLRLKGAPRGIRVVYDSHELFEDQSMIRNLAAKRARRLQRKAAGRLDAVITVNDSIARTLRERYPRLPAPVVVKNATERPSAAVEDTGLLARAAGIERGRKILLYQGGFSARRGLDALVRSAPLLPEDWILVMMGWGTLEARLRDISEKIDPAGLRVRFVPPAPRSELAEWTAGGSLGVIPYENVCLNHWFCSPNKLWEYPVAGVPILASPFPELRGTIERWGIGRFIDDPPTPEGIAAAVAGITDDELREMSANCRSYIAEDNWSVYENRLVGLYRGLTGEAKPVLPNRPSVVVRPQGEAAVPAMTAGEG
jgi:glycosyltransferase involved in cell wall biosynthesis